VPPLLEPMLASTGAIAAPVEDWVFEPKLDGWRAPVYADDGVAVRTWRGRDVSVSLSRGHGRQAPSTRATGPGTRSRDWVKAKTATWRADHAPRRLNERTRTPWFNAESPLARVEVPVIVCDEGAVGWRRSRRGRHGRLR